MSTELMTVDKFIPLLDRSVDRELIQGRLREWPHRFHTPAHSETLATFCHLLQCWEDTLPRPRPSVHGFGAGYLLRKNPDTLIGSDVSVAMAETPRDQFYFDGPPILAVEILEPWDTHGDIVERVQEYLAAGTVVWVVDPDFRRVSVHRPGHEARWLNILQELSADPYLPGFRIAVEAIFND